MEEPLTSRRRVAKKVQLRVALTESKNAMGDQIRRDVIHAVRMLARHRGFALLAIATLALGVGANTAVFTVVDTVIFRPLPYAHPERLVKIWRQVRASPPTTSRGRISWKCGSQKTSSSASARTMARALMWS